ncbi:MAG: MoaD/ThiS family protein [Rhodanobacteraceae bacterium]
MRVKLLYFASLADRAGRSEEDRDSAARTPRDLYAEAAREHGFAFSTDRIRVAVNGALASWDQDLSEGDEIVFLPPVSGG